MADKAEKARMALDSIQEETIEWLMMFFTPDLEEEVTLWLKNNFHMTEIPSDYYICVHCLCDCEKEKVTINCRKQDVAGNIIYVFDVHVQILFEAVYEKLKSLGYGVKEMADDFDRAKIKYFIQSTCTEATLDVMDDFINEGSQRQGLKMKASDLRTLVTEHVITCNNNQNNPLLSVLSKPKEKLE